MIENEIEKPEKQAQTIERKEFMKQVGLSFGAILLLNCLQSCGDSEIPDPNPGGIGDKVDFTLDLNASGNAKLNNPGGFVVIGDKKIIVARTLDAGDKFIAVDSTCTHQGTTITYRATDRDFYCPNHESLFTETGAVKRGPATSALKAYKFTYDATSKVLRIFE